MGSPATPPAQPSDAPGSPNRYGGTVTYGAAGNWSSLGIEELMPVIEVENDGAADGAALVWSTIQNYLAVTAANLDARGADLEPHWLRRRAADRPAVNRHSGGPRRAEATL